MRLVMAIVLPFFPLVELPGSGCADDEAVEPAREG